MPVATALGSDSLICAAFCWLEASDQVQLTLGEAAHRPQIPLGSFEKVWPHLGQLGRS